MRFTMLNLFNADIQTTDGRALQRKRKNHHSDEYHLQQILFMPPWLQHLETVFAIDKYVIDQLRFEELNMVGMCFTQKPELVEALTLMIEEYKPTEHSLTVPRIERANNAEDPTPTIGLTFAKLEDHLRILKNIPQIRELAANEAAATGQDPNALLSSIDFLVLTMEQLQETSISLPVFETGCNPFDFLAQRPDRSGYVQALHEDLVNFFFDNEQVCFSYFREKYSELSKQEAFALFLLALKLKSIINRWCAVQRNMLESMFNDWNDFYELRRSPTKKELRERYPCASDLEVEDMHKCIQAALNLSAPNPLENFLHIFFNFFITKFSWESKSKVDLLTSEELRNLWLSPIIKQRLCTYIRTKFTSLREKVHPELSTPRKSMGLTGDALLEHFFPKEATPTELIQQGILSAEHATRNEAHKRSGDTLKHTFRFIEEGGNNYKTTINIHPGTVVWDTGDLQHNISPHWTIFNRVSTLPKINELAKLKILLTMIATRSYILKDLDGQRKPIADGDYRFFFDETIISMDNNLQLDKLPAFYYVVETPDAEHPETYHKVELSPEEAHYLLSLFRRLIKVLVANKGAFNRTLASMEKRKLAPSNPKLVHQTPAPETQLVAEA